MARGGLRVMREGVDVPDLAGYGFGDPGRPSFQLSAVSAQRSALCTHPCLAESLRHAPPWSEALVHHCSTPVRCRPTYTTARTLQPAAKGGTGPSRRQLRTAPAHRTSLVITTLRLSTSSPPLSHILSRHVPLATSVESPARSCPCDLRLCLSASRSAENASTHIGLPD